MFFYDVVRENHSDSEIGNYDAFGIAVFRITDGAKEQLVIWKMYS